MHRVVSGLLVTLFLIAGAACKVEERHPVVVAQGRVTVINMTDTAWSDVDVWLNNHYRAQAAALSPGQRLDIPIGVFIAGFGQRFDAKKQIPFGVEVDAKGADGKAVRLTWGKGRQR